MTGEVPDWMRENYEHVTYTDAQGVEHLWGFRSVLFTGDCDSCGLTDIQVRDWGGATVRLVPLVLRLCDRCFAAWLDAFANYTLNVGDPPGGWDRPAQA